MANEPWPVVRFEAAVTLPPGPPAGHLKWPPDSYLNP